MYKIDDVGGLFMSMPPNLQSAECEAMCYAVDRQIKKLYALAKRLNMWSDMDGASAAHYDMMALTLNTPYYRSEMTDEQKLNLIKNTPRTKKFLGTVKGMNMFLESVFGDAEIIPWYKYNGEPYHFKVVAYVEDTTDITERFRQMLKKVKAVRSMLDTVEIMSRAETTLHFGMKLRGSYTVVPMIST